MTENITLLYPSWYILLCIGLGFLISGTLYYRNRKFSKEGKWITPVLFLLRLLSVSIISFFLLSPMVSSTKSNTQDPIIILAKDASESIAKVTSPEKLAEINDALKNLATNLSEKYNVQELSFGSEIKNGLQDTFSEKVTNISNLLSHITNNYSNQNLGAIILASDGIYNEGKNPIYSVSSLTAPIYTIALGDTTKKTDLSVKNVFANEIIYLNDKFNVQIDIQAFNSPGQTSKIQIQKIDPNGNKILYTESYTINEDEYFRTLDIVLDADTEGVNRYRISTTPINGEISNTNNFKDIYVQVLDARQKILILAQAPHPDLTALSQIISGNKNYEPTIIIKGQKDYNLMSFDQVIFHNLPGPKSRIDAEIKILKENKTPYLFVVGAQMDIASFNNIQDIMTIVGNGQTIEEIEPSYNNAFKNFNTSEDLRNGLKTFPPLIAPFGEYNLVSTASSLLFQNIRSVQTSYPLVSFQEQEGVKTGIIVGEGIWKWRLFDFLQNGNYEITSELINKIIQFVSKKKDNRKFIVSATNTLYKENESIIINGQLYNDNYELVNDPEVFISVFGTGNQEYQYILNRVNDNYSLDIGILPVDAYSFRAKTTFNGKEYSDRGRFSIQEIQLESFDLEARHNVLFALSDQRGGKVYGANEMNDLSEEILTKAEIKPIIYQNVKTSPLIHLKWIFGILLLLISLEWIIRRYYGSF